MKQTEFLSAGTPYWIYDHELAERYDVDRKKLKKLAKELVLIQIRIKALKGPALKREAELIRDVIRESNPACKIIMNDSAELCKELELDGVHLGQSDGSVPAARKILGPDSIIGLTVRSIEEAKEASIPMKCKVVQYIGVGTVYETTTKQGLEAKGLGFIEEILEMFPADAVYPIGGINEQNIGALYDIGIKHCALSSGLFADALKLDDYLA